MAVAEEREEPPGVVRVPVGEDDAGNARSGDLERRDVPEDGPRVGTGVEEGELRF